MQELKNPRHERFAQLRALEGLGPWAAYQGIGGKGKKAQAWKLMQRPEIKLRIKALLSEEKDKRLDRALYTKNTVVEGLLENIDSAKNGVKLYRGAPVAEDVNHGAINTAWNLLGIEIGMFVKESKIQHLKDEGLDRLTLQELLEHTQRVLWETSDGQIDLDLDALRGVLAHASERDDPDSGPQDRAVQALRQADGVSRDGGEEARAPVHGGEPAGEV